MRTVKVTCPECGGDRVWEQRWMMTIQLVDFFRQDDGRLNWDYTSVYEDQYEVAKTPTRDDDPAKPEVPWFCMDCFSELTTDELVVEEVPDATRQTD